MFGQILYAQWKWSRLTILPCVFACFAIPILSVRVWSSANADVWGPGLLLGRMDDWQPWYPMLSATVGIVVAITAWLYDHNGKHVYALSLPLPRWYYALLKLGAGAVLLTPAIIAVLAGGLVATTFASIPDGLNAYPMALTIRFAITAAVVFSCVFAMAAGTNRTAGIVIGIFSALILVELVLVSFGISESFIEVVFEYLFIPPGPLSVFAGPWMLIGV